MTCANPQAKRRKVEGRKYITFVGRRLRPTSSRIGTTEVRMICASPASIDEHRRVDAHPIIQLPTSQSATGNPTPPTRSSAALERRSGNCTGTLQGSPFPAVMDSIGGHIGRSEERRVGK